MSGSVCDIRFDRQILLVQIIFKRFEKSTLEELQRKILSKDDCFNALRTTAVARRQERFESIGVHFERRRLAVEPREVAVIRKPMGMADTIQGIKIGL